MKNPPNGTGRPSLSAAQARSSNPDSDSAPDQGKEAYDRTCFPDDFYPGLIVLLDRARGRGLIRSSSGREIRFEFPFVTVVGAELGSRAPGIELLHQGDMVGFDMGWTSKGLRVTRIKPARDQRE